MGGITVAFSQCLRAHGLPNFPDPNAQGQVTVNGIDPSSTRFLDAQKACAKYAPNGGKPPTPAEQQRVLAHALKVSRCMRAHGITDFPDPTVQPGGEIGITIRAGPGSDLDPRSPVFQAAQRACGGPRMPRP
jgi:hypothetical protein